MYIDELSSPNSADYLKFPDGTVEDRTGETNRLAQFLALQISEMKRFGQIHQIKKAPTGYLGIPVVMTNLFRIPGSCILTN